MATDLRPLDFGDRLGAAFKLYGSNFTTLVAIVAVIIIPLQLIGFVFGQIYASDLPVTDEGFIDAEAIDAGDIVGFAVGAIVLAIISFIGNLLATGGVVKAVADDTLGNEPHWLDSLSYAFSKLGSLIAGSILFALGFIGAVIVGVLALVALDAVFDVLGVVIGAFLLVVALVILAVSWSIWVPAVIVEDKSGFQALGRSYRLVAGRRWPVFGYLFTIGIIVLLITAIAGGILGALVSDPASPAQAVIDIVIAVLTTPIVTAALVVLYFDQRVRNEGFDAGELAAQMGTDGDDPNDIFGSLPPEDPPEEEPPPEPPGPEGI